MKYPEKKQVYELLSLIFTSIIIIYHFVFNALMVRECKRCGALNEDVLENCVICAAILPRSVTAESRIRIDRRGIFTRGLEFLRYSMPLFIVEAIIFIIISPFNFNLFFNGFSPYYNISTNGVNYGAIANSLPMLENILIVMIGLSIVAFLLMRKGFSMMRIIDSEFRTGVTGTYLLFVGFILLIPGTIVTLQIIKGYVDTLAAESVAHNGTVYFLTNYLYGHYLVLAGGVALDILGGIIAVIGYVMVCLTLYKLGTRFNYRPVKVGALLLFLISFLGSIVLMFSLRNLRSKILGVKEEFT